MERTKRSRRPRNHRPTDEQPDEGVSIPKPTLKAIIRLVAASAGVDTLTPDTRPISIRAALRVARGAGEDTVFLAKIVAAAYKLSWDTTKRIMRELPPSADAVPRRPSDAEERPTSFAEFGHP